MFKWFNRTLKEAKVYKKVISIILTLCMVLSLSGSVLAEETGSAAGNPFFTTVKIPFPDEIEDRNSWLTRARYKDTKEVIPLSMAYHDNVYATIPTQNADRGIEAFVPEEVKFADYDSSNPDFHDVTMLSRVGVIKGNEKGEEIEKQQTDGTNSLLFQVHL